ncbi:hypothetical protein ACEX53_002227 [Escherichia coli]|nr:hypothetical protein [Escherichia coli]
MSSSPVSGPWFTCAQLRAHATSSDSSHAFLAVFVSSSLRGTGKVPAFSMRKRVILHSPV